MRGVIAAGDALTAKAGADILRAGGNAFDAACAALLAAPLSEPALSSLGGGGFLMAYSPGEKPKLYDFFVDVPPNSDTAPDFYPIYVDFGTAVQEFHVGAGSTAIPGQVAGIDKIHRELGKIDIEAVVAPALSYAKNGIHLSTIQSDLIKLLEPIFLSTENSKKIYAPSGKLISNSELFYNQEYGDFLELFVKDGAKCFYKGDLAKDIDKYYRENGGLLNYEELANYDVKVREAISFDYLDYTVYTNPPPSSGGILIAFALELIQSNDYTEFQSIEYIKELIETFAVTAEFRNSVIDAKLHDNELTAVLNNENLIEHYKQSLNSRVNLWGNTTHISIIDAEGNCASVTSTNGEGSGVVIPNTGIMMNNMLGEEDLNPHGFFKWPSGIRLPSMMAPTILLEENIPKLVLGSAGSNRIRSAIIEVIERHLRFGNGIQKAVDAPRMHLEKNELFFEPGFDSKIISEAKKHYSVNEFKDLNLFFGGVNAVTGNYTGGADIRRGGAVEIVD